MNNEQQKAKELAELLTAFADGKQLQFLNDDGYWCDYQATIKDIVEEFLYLDNVQIRIKPETKRVALGINDVLVGRVVRKKDSEYLTMITSQCSVNVLITAEQNYIGDRWYSYENLMELYEFADGTPCYKEVECE